MEAASLAGKRVLVTGGAGGVGRAVATRFINLGARVLIADRHEPDLRRVAEAIAPPTAPGVLEAVAADLSSSSGLAHVFARVDAGLGGLDILVACAGVGSGPLMDMPEQDWRAVIENNLVSYVACTQRAVERMRGQGDRTGIIILVGSISVHIKAVGESVYNASKGGVASFAETLRKEMIPDGIRVTLIEPGAIGSAMQPFSAEERDRQVADHRMLAPEHVAEAILFAATRPPGVDVVTLRIEPLVQKIF
ncbi:SDR family oxidoreductase [Sphingomonas sp. IC4-52]|uniref:SDR family oxidoreductase n=1 Tax=Sphingomonas sp. IC4-52 TaxID=2887202 RepID=UPI001D1211A6|nr:SDR family oxidoreductase [Sphingomonas sp. IC4-52]MCC2981121.1 SDR family oxidoreductase [Sphingomonas sp. IC4-52]